MALPAVSVVLVSWNTRELLDACLQNLLPQVTVVGAEVWVVDNASHDGSADMVATAHPWAFLIRNDVNVGFSRACNLAIPRAAGRYVFFFNPDATLEPGGLATMTALLDRRPRLGAIMPRILSRDGSPTHYVGRAPRLLAARMRLARWLAWQFPASQTVQAFWSRTLEVYRAGAERGGELYDRPSLEGAALFVRRAAMDEVGGLDPAFFCGWEEADLTLRMRRAGWKLAVTPRASVRHWDQQSRSQWDASPWEIADGCYFIRKNKGIRALRRHAAEQRRLIQRSAPRADSAALIAEQDRCLTALLKSPSHPGYPPEMK